MNKISWLAAVLVFFLAGCSGNTATESKYYELLEIAKTQQMFTLTWGEVKHSYVVTSWDGDLYCYRETNWPGDAFICVSQREFASSLATKSDLILGVDQSV